MLFAKLEYASFKGAALRSFQLGQVTEADFQQQKGSTTSSVLAAAVVAGLGLELT